MIQMFGGKDNHFSVASDKTWETPSNRLLDGCLQNRSQQPATKNRLCSPGKAIDHFFRHLNEKPTKIMILGGGCSKATAPVARTATYFNLVQMSYSTGSGELSNRENFPTFFRTSASDVALVMPHISLMKKFGWHRVATISQNDPMFSVTIDDLHRRLHENSISLITSEIFLTNPGQQLQNIVVLMILAVICILINRKDARIIILASYEGTARRVMCEAYNLGVYGRDYQWLVPGWFDAHWYDINDTRCTITQVKMALNYAFTFSDMKEDTSSTPSISGQVSRSVLRKSNNFMSMSNWLSLVTANDSVVVGRWV
ncbi:gamma-aminobutyric acid type B receptor subunit 1-like [Tubulanus polymorphus]|uniref:gamma-aminobutyric acid type B receptor subunit 1-like n=1 Tax=Tubulanus polymorphus TaxID=672921 RepID=UPI003DA51365